MVVCARYKQEMEGLDEPPFDSDFGQKIYNQVSKKAWSEWIERQKMLLNEYRLQPWTREAQEFLVEQMQEYFFGEGSALPKEYVPARSLRSADRRTGGARMMLSAAVVYTQEVNFPSGRGSAW
jgi:Fe-S cluster biosynthesis and repair protein YggX